jgi:drug/metabolite transporter (DMT)-like permease
MRLALLAAAATGIQVGATIVASRGVVADVPPLTLALLRYAIGVLSLLPFALKDFKHFWPSTQTQQQVNAPFSKAKDLSIMLLLGVGQFAVLIALLNLGLQHVPAARAALLFALFPLLTLVMSVGLGHERPTASLVWGVLLSIAGVALSLGPRLLGAQGGAWWGHAAVLGSATVGALCSVAYRPYLRRYPTLAVSALAMGASVVFLAVVALVEHWPTRVLALPLRHWGIIAFIGLSSGAAYFAWLYALKHESPTRVTVFLALNPPTAALLGWWGLNEPVDVWTLSAMLCIAAALGLATRPARPEALPSPCTHR